MGNSKSPSPTISKGSTRPPFRRLVQIKSLIEAGDYPNCNTLARQLEVGAKTIQRDITFMRDQMGIPVVYDSKKFGFYFAGPVKLSDPLDVSEGELAAILIAQKALQQHWGTAFEAPLRSACRKIEEALRGRVSVNLEDLEGAFSFRESGVAEVRPEVFEVVGQAVRESRELGFQYKKLGAEGFEERVVQPYHLGCVNNQWYLFCFDIERQEMRTFVLSRLQSPQLRHVTFERPSEFSITDYLAHSLNVFRSAGEPVEVRVRFDSWGAGLVRGRQWHHSQKVQELAGGGLELEFRLAGLEEVDRWVLGFGGHARAISPPGLVDRLRATIRRMGEQYELAPE